MGARSTGGASAWSCMNLSLACRHSMQIRQRYAEGICAVPPSQDGVLHYGCAFFMKVCVPSVCYQLLAITLLEE